MKKLMLIFNPNSGKHGMRDSLQDILLLFHENGWEVTVFPTHKAGDATTYILDRYADFDLVVCCGGDGTLNETITGLMQQPLPPKLGYIPVGTANDLATTLHLKKNPVEAAKDILENHTFIHDIGRLNDRYFAYIAACGTFSNISYSTPQAMKRSLGKIAYILEAVKNISDIRPRHLKVILDGTVIEDNFVICAVMNSISFAGLFRLKEEEICLHDGVFEVLLIRPPKNPLHVRKMMDQLLHRRYDGDDITLYHAREIEVITENETPWCVDGEMGGSYKEVKIHAEERKMTFCASKSTSEETIELYEKPCQP